MLRKMIKEIDKLKGEALNPSQSVIVESCAGSGKTWLLISRIIRILLDEVPPSEILAVTFTRKAAQQMEQRLYGWLHMLASGTSDDVRNMLLERGVPLKDIEGKIPKAKGLLTKVLTSRPGITICTFHSWFLTILRHAPLVNLSKTSGRLAEEQFLLFDEAWGRFSLSLEKEENLKERQALVKLIKEYGLANTRKLIQSFLSKRIEWWSYVCGEKYPIESALGRLRKYSQIKMTCNYVNNLMDDVSFAVEINRYVDLLTCLETETARTYSYDIKHHMECGDREQTFYKLIESIFTKTQPRKIRSYDSQTQRKIVGNERMDLLIKTQKFLGENLLRAKQSIEEQRSYQLCEAVFVCGASVLEFYQKIKEQKNLIDYLDIEWRARNLISESEDAEYVQYKLDVRYNHVLVDELQDTNPTQWAIIKSWLDSSKSGGNKLTFFGVGDQKQSIYRFRGAEPKIFEICKAYFSKNYAAKVLSNVIARRNAPQIVYLVNKIFEKSCINFQRHTTFRKDIKGQILVIPLNNSQAPQNATKGDWRNPLISGLQETAKKIDRTEEAEELAKRIFYMVENWQVADEEGPRQAKFSDILILVRSRTHLEAYEKGLRRNKIPFLGAWQGGLLQAIEIVDMISLLRFLSNGTSNLDLAVVLKSPVFLLTDHDLLQISKAGNSENWWESLKFLVDTEQASRPLCRAYELLGNWINLVDTLPVHDLLDRIFNDSDLLQKYQDEAPSSVVTSVLSNLQKFLELSLLIDSGRYPSLQSFLENLSQLAHLDKINPREAPSMGDQSGLNAVRILTVHGAKGLEAPIVWLIDSNTPDKTGRATFSSLVKWDADQERPKHFSFYTKKEEMTVSQSKIIQTDDYELEMENERLFYVALTRAKDVLVVSGSGKLEHDSWYHRISDTADHMNIDDYRKCFTAKWEAKAGITEFFEKKYVPYQSKNLKIGERVRQENNLEREFGIQLHQLLELLVPPANGGDRDEIKSKFNSVSKDKFDILWDAAQAILQAKDIQQYMNPIYYKRAWNELSFAEPNGIIRRIDRVVEFDDKVCVIDYKTGVEDRFGIINIRDDYCDQLRSYCCAIREIFKGKKTFGLIVTLEGKIVFKIES